MKMLLARWRGSLWLRLLLGTACWVVLAVLVAGWGLSSLFSQHVQRQFQAELGTHLDQLAAALVVGGDGKATLRAPLSDPRLLRPYSGLYWQLDQLDERGAVERVGVSRSRSLWDGVLTVPADAPADGRSHLYAAMAPDGERVLVLEQTMRPVGAPDRPVRVLVAGNESFVVEPVSRFNGLLTLSLVILSLGLILATLVQLRIALKPMGRLRAELGRVHDGLAPRIDGVYPSEIQPLVDEFNGVLASNAEVVARARTQAGNLAHALKTPLAILRNSAEGGEGALVKTVVEQTRLANRHIDHHLARARAAAAVRVPGRRVVVRPVLEGLLRVMSRVHAEQNRALILRECPQHVCFGGEEQDLQEMLGNLLDNACKWARSTVSASVTQDGRSLRIDIEDDGPGLPPEVREKVLQRGVRADEQQPGSGLGLAIVRDLARLYGGDVSLDASASGGLRARLSLPAA